MASASVHLNFRLGSGRRPILCRMSALRLSNASFNAKRPVVLTRDGVNKLEVELNDLEHAHRAEIADHLRAAREFGDGLENSELLEAKAEAWRLEYRISELKALLADSLLMQPALGPRGEVRLGSRVVLSSEFGREEYVVVGSVEADPLAQTISNESPLGRALIGRHQGDAIEWNSPAGPLRARVQRVS